MVDFLPSERSTQQSMKFNEIISMQAFRFIRMGAKSYHNALITTNCVKHT